MVVGFEKDLPRDIFPLFTALSRQILQIKSESVHSLEMLPQKGMVTQPKPIMLCAVCYGEKPYHRIVWQNKHKRGCQVHGLELLSWAILIGIISAYLSYQWMLNCAIIYGDLLESTFDLYRFELYKALHFP